MVRGRNKLIYICAMGIVGVWLLVAKPGSAAGPLMINLFLLHFFQMLMIVPHEAGHAVAGHLLGYHISKVQLGMGQPWLRIQMGGVQVEFRVLPFGGFTFASPEHPPALWGRLLFVLAGPLASAICAGMAFLVFYHRRGFELHFFQAVDPLGMFLIANLLILLASIFPYTFPSGGHEVASDGQIVLNVLFPGQPKPPVPIAEPEAGADDLPAFLRSVHIVFLACITVISLALTVNFFPSGGPDDWVGLCLLAGFIATVCILIKVVRTPLRARTISGGDPRMVIRELQGDLIAPGDWKMPGSPETVYWRVQKLIEKNDLLKARELLDHTRETNGDHLCLDFLEAALLEKDDSAAAEAHFTRMLARPGLSLGSRTVFLSEKLKTMVKQGKFELVRETAESFLQDAIPREHQVSLLDSLACLPIMDGIRSYLADADRWSLVALELDPDNLTLQGTRASLLVEQGRVEEAHDMLKKVYSQSQEDADRGISAFYLALVAKHRGDSRAAKSWAKRARAWFPAPWLMARISAEFGKP